jgi:hypothetical protein
MPYSRFLVSSKLVAASMVLAALVVGMTLAFAQTQGGAAVNEGRQISLKEQLTFGLMVRTKAEREFIDLVVAKVEAGELPRPLVNSTFLWARDRAAKRRDSTAIRPMIYFRPGLLARAKKMKINL